MYQYIDYPRRRPRFITEWACGLVYQSQTEGQFVLATHEHEGKKWKEILKRIDSIGYLPILTFAISNSLTSKSQNKLPILKLTV